MLKKKNLKTIIIIFAIIALISLSSSLFRGLGSYEKSNDNSNANDSGDTSTACEHEFETVSSVPPTCTTLGLKTAKCTLCDKLETIEFPMLDHIDDYLDCVCDVCESEFHHFVGDTCDVCGSHVCIYFSDGYYCDNCGSLNNDHSCDYDENGCCYFCYEVIEHECDYDETGRCYICYEPIEHVCEDNEYHTCDICGLCPHYFGSDTLCHYCNYELQHADDFNKDMNCDICGGDLTKYLVPPEDGAECRDDDDDGECDWCTKSYCDGVG